MPSRSGREFTSLTRGPSSDSRRSIPVAKPGVIRYRVVDANRSRTVRRAVRGAVRRSPGLSERFEAYESVCRQLAKALLDVPAPEQAAARRERVRELSERREKLEVALSEESEVFREEQDSRRLASAELAAGLPEGAVLVDFLVYRHLEPREPGRTGPSKWQTRCVAFVVRPGAEAARVDLGPAEAIDGLVGEWRAEVKRGGSGAVPGGRLRDLVWAPVSKHLGAARTVLVSPDGALARLPFVALPGAEPGSFLLDEYAFATVAVPRLLPALLAKGAAGGKTGSLLLVGEVDYGAKPGAPESDALASARAAPRAGLRGAWDPLPGTRSEVLAVLDSFERRFEGGEAKTLRRERATEEAFREAAGRDRFLHVATHGFFAPAEVRSALAGEDREGVFGEERPLTGFHPGLLSGIVLAGANLPVESGADDGILTALEVAALDFAGTELVVLSACETGLGEVAGGEGVLGLQRAFQMAGARSAVTSLWKVDDRAANLLMTLFYEKLWGEGIPKAEALRQAKLALMRDEGIRGLRVEEPATGEPPGRLPPVLWAAFTLSGDWR
jgi:CHAT domain-containing protein